MNHPGVNMKPEETGQPDALTAYEFPFTADDMAQQKAKGGRPPKAEHLVNDVVISVRITRAAFEALKALEQLTQKALEDAGVNATVNAANIIRTLIEREAKARGVWPEDAAAPASSAPKSKAKPSKSARAQKATKAKRQK